MLHLVMKLLPARDLAVAVLVCRRWRMVGESPGLWTWVSLPSVSWGRLDTMPEVLGWRRLATATKLRVRAVSEELLLAVVRHQGLRELEFDCTTLCDTRADLLARVVAHMERVNMVESPLTRDQTEAVFAAISEGTQLKRLEIRKGDVTTLRLSLLENAVLSLHELIICYESFTLHSLFNGEYPIIPEKDNLKSEQVSTVCDIVSVVTINISKSWHGDYSDLERVRHSYLHKLVYTLLHPCYEPRPLDLRLLRQVVAVRQLEAELVERSGSRTHYDRLVKETVRKTRTRSCGGAAETGGQLCQT